MSNRRKTTPASGSGGSGLEHPIAILDQYEAFPLTKPGAAPLVSLNLLGANIETGEPLSVGFVMFPAEARALIDELRRALPE